MTRQRRTHLVILALVPLVVFGAVRCADAPTGPSAVALQPDVALKLARLHAKYDSTGIIHNAMLSHVLGDLQRIPESGRTRAVVCETAHRSAGDFYKATFAREMPQAIEGDFLKSCLGTGAKKSISGSLIVPGSAPAFDLSESAVNSMDQAADAIDVSSGPSDFESQIAGIEADAAANLSEEETAAVVMVGSVATSSAEYWSTNLLTWVYFGNTPDYSRFAPSASRDIAPMSVGGPAFSSYYTDIWDELWKGLVGAGKTVVKADARSAAKMILTLTIGGLPMTWQVIGSAAAVGSMAALLHI